MKRRSADLLLILITAIWGLSFPIIRNSLEFVPEITYLFYRFALASLVLIVIFRKRYKEMSTTLLLKGMLLGLVLSGALGFTVAALQYTTASNVAFITGINIVIVPVLANLIMHKRIDIIKKISIGIALIGLLLISGGVELRFNMGDFLAFLCALCISAQIILTDIFAAKEDPIALGCLQVNFATVPYFFLCLAGTSGFVLVLNSTVVLTIAITGIVGTALAFVGQTYIQKFTSPSHVAIIFILEPVFGAIFAMLIPKLDGTTESIYGVKAIGCVLLVVSMLLTELFPQGNMHLNRRKHSQ